MSKNSFRVYASCHIGDAAENRLRERGSASVTRDAYLADTIEPGAVVGWIFNNEEAFGYRIK